MRAQRKRKARRVMQYSGGRKPGRTGRGVIRRPKKPKTLPNVSWGLVNFEFENILGKRKKKRG